MYSQKIESINGALGLKMAELMFMIKIKVDKQAMQPSNWSQKLMKIQKNHRFTITELLFRFP